ncbi:hypothetical protein BDV96DRAFT_598132 [Lophiotrema nucula]|uniref:Uncharacterized protein n=1 Tax=Lophiotrema nucula TaxID=690887 RepID=A0A6A5ZDB3_9PLEO|nr:hypothetical protein BDV96DRAFT_598132 [Lophiotrema nucula]
MNSGSTSTVVSFTSSLDKAYLGEMEDRLQDSDILEAVTRTSSPEKSNNASFKESNQSSTHNVASRSTHRRPQTARSYSLDVARERSRKRNRNRSIAQTDALTATRTSCGDGEDVFAAATPKVIEGLTTTEKIESGVKETRNPSHLGMINALVSVAKEKEAKNGVPYRNVALPSSNQTHTGKAPGQHRSAGTKIIAFNAEHAIHGAREDSASRISTVRPSAGPSIKKLNQSMGRQEI